MNFSRIRYFQSVAMHQSFRRAAEALGISQPSLSRQIQVLERECGAALFRRVNRKIALTAAGQVLLTRSAPLLKEMEDLKQSLADVHSGQLNRLMVGAIQSTLDYPIPAAIAAVRRRHPRLFISIRGIQSSEIIESVSRGHLDVGIVATPVTDPRITVEPIARERYVAIFPAGHPLAGGKRLAPPALAEEQLVTFPRGYVIRDRIDAAFADAGAAIKLVAEIESIEAIKAMVRQGVGMTILPQSALAGPVGAIGLAVVPVEAPPLERDIVAARLASADASPVVDQFIDAMKHAFIKAQMPSGHLPLRPAARHRSIAG